MEKVAWTGVVVEGMMDEYVRRHDELWEEMREVLTAAGICNYTIWASGNRLFGYYECMFGVEYAQRVQKESPVIDRWNEHMKDILILQMDEKTGAQPQMRKVFEFGANEPADK